MSSAVCTRTPDNMPNATPTGDATTATAHAAPRSCAPNHVAASTGGTLMMKFCRVMQDLSARITCT
eukprot:14111217-Alexandrium_andersonii.AAC.1